jgi:hypothetical protein
VAESADELEVLRPRFGVFPNTTDLAILAAGGTENKPSGQIRNVSIDGYRHAFIIQLLEGSPTFDLGQPLRGPVPGNGE